jgi:2-polyprenyl-3-methyl-5-hydroxy-6-metoxy-1,4-benzoquinol methylase
MKYDEAYDKIEHVFGREPETILVKYRAAMDPARPVLDIGAGQGRQALYLARQGFEVAVVEPSRAGINIISKEAATGQLPVTVHQGTIDQFPAEDGSYSGVLLFGLIQELSRESLTDLVLKIGRLLQAGGILFVTAFSTRDPAYDTHAAEWERIGRHSFQNESGTIRTYLEPDEVLKIFAGYEVLYHREQLGPEHRHGDGLPQRHFRIEYVGRKPPVSGR